MYLLTVPWLVLIHLVPIPVVSAPPTTSLVSTEPTPGPLPLLFIYLEIVNAVRAAYRSMSFVFMMHECSPGELVSNRAVFKHHAESPGVYLTRRVGHDA